MKATGDVVIVGGGVIGLTTAYYLAREGVRVVVCERLGLGQEASWAGAGILPPSDPAHARHPFDRLRALSGQLYPDLSHDLLGRTGIDNGYQRCGGIVLTQTLAEADALEWYGAGLGPERVTSAQFAELEPALASDVGPAALVPDLAQVRNPRHLQALAAACQTTGRVEVRLSEQPAEVVAAHGRVAGIRDGHGTLAAHTVVVSAGAWTDRVLASLNIVLGIQPVRGQIALLNLGRTIFRRVLIWGARYLVPRGDGRILVGSTEEHVGFTKATTADGIRGLLDLALTLVPELALAAVERSWAGLRPGSPDGLPFIGPVPGIDNLYVAAGHFRTGIQLAPGTAWLLKEMILGQALSLPIEPYRLERPT